MTDAASDRPDKGGFFDLTRDPHFERVVDVTLPRAFTWADMRPGHTDREKRESIREQVLRDCPPFNGTAKWWAFRITVAKGGRRSFDLENVTKPIVDAFSQKQIQKDRSAFPEIGLFEDDSIDFVRLIQVYGERRLDGDSTRIEIFAKTT